MRSAVSLARITSNRNILSSYRSSNRIFSSTSDSNNIKSVLPSHNPDGLTRYPTLTSTNGMLRGLDWIGTISFAASGTVTAGFAGMDALGCTLVGLITATGGGTIRDLLIGQAAFWTTEVEYLWLILATSGLTFLAFDKEDKASIFAEDGQLMYWTDTFGLGAFACIGAQNAIRRGLPGLVILLCGMLTATGGGVVRDTLCGKPARILHNNAEIYATTALTGAFFYEAARQLSFSPTVRILSGVFSVVGLRYWATTHDIKLPHASWFENKSTSLRRNE